MSKSTYFVQDCPTCGRRLEIRVEHLGKVVTCQHCRGRFQASESSNAADRLSDPTASSWLLRRAEELLELAQRNSLPR